jgi:hypothetical protein
LLVLKGVGAKEISGNKVRMANKIKMRSHTIQTSTKIKSVCRFSGSAYISWPMYCTIAEVSWNLEIVRIQTIACIAFPFLRKNLLMKKEDIFYTYDQLIRDNESRNGEITIIKP